MAKYLRAETGNGKSVIYTDSQGKKWKYQGGSRAWRNHNPGNLIAGKVSKRNGAIGEAGGFAIFPDYETGHTALLDSLKNEHGSKDITKLMYVFAPPKENNTKRYIKYLRRKTGVKGNKRILDFSPSEFSELWKAIEKMEGWGQEGTITEYSEENQITAVKKNKKGTIEAYFIKKFGWVPKKRGIDLTQKGKINAVIATSRRGNQFLRSRPNSQVSDNLGSLG